MKALARLPARYSAERQKREMLARFATGEVVAAAFEAVATLGGRLTKYKLFTPHHTLWGPDWHREDDDFWTDGISTFRRPSRETGFVSSRRGGVPLPRLSSAQVIVATGFRIDPAGIAAVWPTDGTRAPSRKFGRPPSDEAIMGKADEMHARGLRGHEIAKTMRLEIGFENVATRAVRELILGRYSQGRKKSAHR